MTDVFINNRLWGLKGVIGRREYILNSAYVAVLLVLVMLPYIWWITQTPNVYYGNPNIIEIFKLSPIYAKISLVVCWLVGIPLSFSLKSRRLGDIFSADTDWRIYLVIALIILASYWAALVSNYWILYLVFIIDVLLYCVKGKVTGQLPKDEVKRFNWGAFWGTWIWGLINKSYKTLWAIPALILFPIFPYIQVICGIKGNEWAYEKTQNKELAVFHKGQKHQAIFWNIFTGVILLPALLILSLALAIAGFISTHPDEFNKALTEYNQKVEAFVDDYFESYELGGIENKFYLDPQKWTEMTPKQKKGMIYYLASFASRKKDETQALLTTQSQELIITKIYSTYNGEILSEFIVNKPGKNVRETMKSHQNFVKINDNPTLP